MMEEAYVTMATSNLTAHGCLVLGHSLRLRETRHPLIVLINDDVTRSTSCLLQQVFDVVERVPKVNTQLRDIVSDTELVTKIRCWRLTNYSKCVFLSADTLVLQNCDELFERPELSAVPNVSWPDWFDSNVFVFNPNLHTYWRLINHLREKQCLEGGDEQLLNEYFHKHWRSDLQRRLPFTYNLVCSRIYSYAPAFHQYSDKVKIVQFVGQSKPWSVLWDRQSGRVVSSAFVDDSFLPYYQAWTDIFIECVLNHLTEHEKPASSYVQVADFVLPLEEELDTATTIVAEPQDNDISPLFFPHMPFDQTEYCKPSLVPRLTLSFSGLETDVNENTVATIVESKPCIWADGESRTTDTPNPAVTPRMLSTEKLPSIVVNEETYSSSSVVGTVPVECSADSYVNDDEDFHMKRWHHGDVDYLGQDSFENIWKRLSTNINETVVNRRTETLDLPVVKTETDCDEELDLTVAKIKIDRDEALDLPVVKTETDRDESVHDESEGIAVEDAALKKPDEPSEIPGYAIGNYDAMHNWEKGKIDYDGRDSSDNIMKRLDFFIHSNNEYNLGI